MRHYHVPFENAIALKRLAKDAVVQQGPWKHIPPSTSQIQQKNSTEQAAGTLPKNKQTTHGTVPSGLHQVFVNLGNWEFLTLSLRIVP